MRLPGMDRVSYAHYCIMKNHTGDQTLSDLQVTIQTMSNKSNKINPIQGK